MADAVMWDKELPTYLDLAMGFGKDGEVYPLINTLSRTNEILQDISPVQCNNGMKHSYNVIVSDPEIYYKRFNRGTPDSTFQMGYAEDTCAMLEGRAMVDAELLRMSKNKPEYLYRRDQQFLSAFNKVMASSLFYGSIADDPGSFNGFSVRYNQKGGDYGENVLDAGGKTGKKLTSVWLIVWNPNTIFTIYPENSPLGFSREDLGIRSLQQKDADGRLLSLEVQQTKYMWRLGLCVADPRYAVRICNLDVDDLRNGTGTQSANAQTNLMRLMIEAMNIVPSLSDGRAAFYMNRHVYSSLQKQGLNFSQNVLSFTQAVSQFAQPGSVGKTFTSFQGVPMRRVDALRTDEPQVVAA